MTNHKIRLRATMGILGFGTFQTHESPTLWPSFQNSVPWANSLDLVQPLLAWFCFEFWCLPCLPSIALLFHFSPLVIVMIQFLKPPSVHSACVAAPSVAMKCTKDKAAMATAKTKTRMVKRFACRSSSAMWPSQILYSYRCLLYSE